MGCCEGAYWKVCNRTKHIELCRPFAVKKQPEFVTEPKTKKAVDVFYCSYFKRIFSLHKLFDADIFAKFALHWIVYLGKVQQLRQTFVLGKTVRYVLANVPKGVLQQFVGKGYRFEFVEGHVLQKVASGNYSWGKGNAIQRAMTVAQNATFSKVQKHFFAQFATLGTALEVQCKTLTFYKAKQVPEHHR